MDSKALAAFRQQLVDLRSRLIQEIDSTEEALREDIATTGEVAPSPMHPADQDAEGMEEMLGVAQNEEQMLEDVEAALERMEAGSFGVCQDCGRTISQQRLRAIPYTPWCIDCARGQEPRGA